MISLKPAKNRFFPVVLSISLVVFLHGVNQLLFGELYQFSLYPRELESLPNIFLAPLLHADWAHVFNNVFGLFIFGTFCSIEGKSFFIRSSLTIIIISGLLVWLFGRPAYHIGASGWIFGLWSLCIANAWLKKSFKSISIAIVIIVFYGSMIFGVLPLRTGISFEYHLFGMFAGIVAAFLYSSKTPTE